MPSEGLTWHSINFISINSTEELSDEFVVSWDVSWVHSSGLVVLNLWMLLGESIWQLSWTSAKPDSLNLKVWLFSEDAVSGEGVFGGVLSSVQEAGYEVVSNMEDLSFLAVLLIVEEPESPTIPVEHLVPLINSGSLLVCVVDVEGLEIVDVESGWWEALDVILCLHDFLLLSLWLLGSLLLWSLWCFNEVGWLEWLGGQLDATLNGDVLWESVDASNPWFDVLHGLSETGVKDGLESTLECGGEDDISKSNAVSDEPFLSFEGSVKGLKMSLQVFGLLVVISSLDSWASENTSADNLPGWSNGGLSPCEPLVDLGLGDVGGTEQFS